jgi:hypothetical protein
MFRKTAFSVLLVLSPACVLAETAAQDTISYPAPPGVYGNPELLMMFDEQQASPESAASDKLLPPGPTPHVQPSLPAESEAPPQAYAAPQAEPAIPLLIMQPAQPTQNGVITQPPSTVDYRHYPDASVLQKQMNEASQLEFSQWGFDDKGTAAVNPQYPASAYEYGPEMFLDSHNYNQYFENPYPISQQPSTNYDRFEMIYDTQPASRPQSRPVMPDYPVPDYYSYGYDMMESTPSRLKSQLPYENDLYAQPPVDPYLRQSEQYPLPESVYGMPAQNTQMPVRQQGHNAFGGSNTQYFRKIPEEEIIYPPNYPGNLR